MILERYNDSSCPIHYSQISCSYNYTGLVNTKEVKMDQVIQTIINKNKALDNLFDEWEKAVSEYKGKFIRDGINNEELYKFASSKILFIAKEPNDTGQTAWDFRDGWKQELDHPFSYRRMELRTIK